MQENRASDKTVAVGPLLTFFSEPFVRDGIGPKETDPTEDRGQGRDEKKEKEMEAQKRGPKDFFR